MKELQDFSHAIMTLDDRIIENNYKLTLTKRNKAPIYADMSESISKINEQLGIIIELEEAKEKTV